MRPQHPAFRGAWNVEPVRRFTIMKHHIRGLPLIIITSLVVACGSSDEDDSGGSGGTSPGNGGQSSGGAGLGGSDGGGSSSGGVGATGGSGVDGDATGALSVTGTLDGEAFTIDCVDVVGQIYSGNGQYNFQCRVDGPNATITGPIFLFDFNTTAVDVGTRHVGGSDPRAYNISRAGDYANFGPDTDDDTADLTIEIADDTRLKGSLGGSWTQPDYSNNMVPVTVEMAGTFDVAMEVL